MSEWPAYNDLAWVEPILVSPRECEDEASVFIEAIKNSTQAEVTSLLHLGCGAGSYDYTFKKHFETTGVDISRGMLGIAVKRNPEVAYHHGDMRSIRLNRKFDAVAIPDSIGYMITEADLRKALSTAYEHLKPGGVLIITAHTSEQFIENNFIYKGSEGDVDVTVFENNYITGTERTSYEATMIYLIRRNGELEIFTDRHVLGLFTLNFWHRLLKEQGFELKKIQTEHLYNRFIRAGNEYPLEVFICTVQEK